METSVILQSQKLAEMDRRNDPDINEGWKSLPGYFNLPVELDAQPESAMPWMTWLTAFLIAVLSISAFWNLGYLIQQFGLVPNKLWRYDGLTFVSSFFLHASAWHLIGNLYFLVLFGRRVERDVGPWRWLLLLFAAALIGDILDVLLDPRGDLPCVGASGGISGLLAYYVLRFPTVEIGIPVRFALQVMWIEIPAWAWFAMWMFLQFADAWQQMSGLGDVASLAHVGGALAGLICWLWWRNRPPDAGSPDTGGKVPVNLS